MLSYTPLFKYERLKTLPVLIGKIILGNGNPIRLQSMTNTLTNDIENTVNQCKKIFDAGADFVRITVPSMKDVENFKKIKEELHKSGYTKPLIADVHFNYKIAYEVAKVAEKIRINPGNFIPANGNPDNVEKQIEEKFTPLIEICKQYNTAIRIGVNHGSLPQYILEKYGDTPQGMVETAMQFIKICQKNNFHQVVVSMKASNPLIMVYSNRLLINRMIEEGIMYPIHIGVTEAGEGEEGRIKSSIGIGCLLLDGIGDTIRVSLTEDPKKEIPVAKTIINYIEEKKSLKIPYLKPKIPHNPFEYNKIKSISISNFGGKNLFKVLISVDVNQNTLKLLNQIFEKNIYKGQLIDGIFIKNVDDFLLINELIKNKKPLFINYQILNNTNINSNDNIIPVLKPNELDFNNLNSFRTKCLVLSLNDVNDDILNKIKNSPDIIILIENDNETDIYGQRALIYHLVNNNILNPLILKRNYNNISSLEELQIKASIDFSIFLVDGYCDGMIIDTNQNFLPEEILNLSYDILQASRRRITKTEFISCPTCGRTHFNIIEVLKTIKSKTGHLIGTKIAVMGCNVNGPGEMADADYGYVGAGPGKVNLYKGKQLVKKNIPESEAIDELIKLIKISGDWIDNNK